MQKYYIGITIIVLACMASFGAYFAIGHNVITDQQTSADLTTLSEAVRAYTDKNKALPDTLDQLDLPQKKVKPRLGRYSYTKVGPFRDAYENQQQYELCATFKKSANDEYAGPSNSSSGYESYINASNHAAGHVCYKLYVADFSRNSVFNNPSVNKAPVPPPVATANSELAACGKTDPKINAVNSAVTIKSVDLSSKSMQTTKLAVTGYYYWSVEPQVFDAKCGAIKLSALLAGERVNIYYNSSGHTDVYMIKKLD